MYYIYNIIIFQSLNFINTLHVTNVTRYKQAIYLSFNYLTTFSI